MGQKKPTNKERNKGMSEEEVVEEKKESKLKGIICADLIVSTGFSRVAHGIFDEVSKYHDITGIGVNYRGDPHQCRFPVFPAFVGGDLYGIKRLADILNSQDFDFLFILNDVWVINMYLEYIKKEVKKELPKIYIYFPVDAEEHSKKWYQNFDIVTKSFTYTEFGKKVVKKVNPNIDIGIMPHGTDTESFYKKFEKKADAKRNLFKEQLQKLGDPNELFVILNGNRNQPRKRLDISMEGFSLFARDKPSTVKYYSHAGVVDASMDLIELSERYKIDDRLILTSINRGVQSVPISYLNDIYNASDIGLNTSMGEGWGLVNTEHACTGAPQIVPDHSACTELFHDCGLLMDTVTTYTFDNSMVVGKLVTPYEVADKLQILYDDRKLLTELGEKGRQKFTQEKYKWNIIAEQWKKIFEDGAS